MKFYIATRLERAEEQKALAAMLTELGHSITYDWAQHGSVQSGGPDRIREVAASECAGVIGADLVIVMLPGGRGTHTELGIAIADSVARKPTGNRCGNEKRIVIIGYDDGGVDGRTCAFYHHPQIDHRFATSSEFVAFMRGLKVAGGEWR
jgi:hypothetical protein